jgi:hypothetical protein
VVIVGGISALVARVRLRVAVSGVAELLNDGYGRMTESFVFHVRSGRDHPVKIEEFGIYGQDTHGDYRQITVMNVPLNTPPISKGSPYRVEIPFGYLSGMGVDVRRRLYAFARLAQPAKVVWSHRMTAGPQRPSTMRSLPTARTRNANEPATQPPWRVRWFQ